MSRLRTAYLLITKDNGQSPLIIFSSYVTAVTRLPIHHIFQRKVLFKRNQITNKQRYRSFHYGWQRILPGYMRRDDGIWKRPKRMLRRQRLRIHHVKACAKNPVGLQGIAKRIRINGGAASDVQYDGILFQ